MVSGPYRSGSVWPRFPGALTSLGPLLPGSTLFLLSSFDLGASSAAWASPEEAPAPSSENGEPETSTEEAPRALLRRPQLTIVARADGVGGLGLGVVGGLSLLPDGLIPSLSDGLFVEVELSADDFIGGSRGYNVSLYALAGPRYEVALGQRWSAFLAARFGVVGHVYEGLFGAFRTRYLLGTHFAFSRQLALQLAVSLANGHFQGGGGLTIRY